MRSMVLTEKESAEKNAFIRVSRFLVEVKFVEKLFFLGESESRCEC